MDATDVDVSVILPVATRPEQVQSINNCRARYVLIGLLHWRRSSGSANIAEEVEANAFNGFKRIQAPTAMAECLS